MVKFLEKVKKAIWPRSFLGKLALVTAAVAGLVFGGFAIAGAFGLGAGVTSLFSLVSTAAGAIASAFTTAAGAIGSFLGSFTVSTNTGGTIILSALLGTSALVTGMAVKNYLSDPNPDKLGNHGKKLVETSEKLAEKGVLEQERSKELAIRRAEKLDQTAEKLQADTQAKIEQLQVDAQKQVDKLHQEAQRQRENSTSPVVTSTAKPETATLAVEKASETDTPKKPGLFSRLFSKKDSHTADIDAQREQQKGAVAAVGA